MITKIGGKYIHFDRIIPDLFYSFFLYSGEVKVINLFLIFAATRINMINFQPDGSEPTILFTASVINFLAGRAMLLNGFV